MVMIIAAREGTRGAWASVRGEPRLGTEYEPKSSFPATLWATHATAAKVCNAGVFDRSKTH